MQQVPLPKQKKNRFRPKWHRFILLTLAVIVPCVGLEGFKQQRLQARDLPTQPVEITSTWQYASFPVENFQAYTSPFGYRISPIDGARQFHRGLDMAAPLGSYVRNWWTGKVVELSDDTACGTLIKIQSGQWTHIYCHLMGHVETTANGRYLIDRDGGIQLRQGQEVPVGARIGRVGMTGRTTGPHLHWGLMHNNNYVDPALVLREMHKQQTASIFQ
ncbi:MAG: M23 family metallopeptidase [Xenococcaceae cyanobacterium]